MKYIFMIFTFKNRALLTNYFFEIFLDGIHSQVIAILKWNHLQAMWKTTVSHCAPTNPTNC